MINVNDKLIKQDLAKIGAEGFAVLMAIAIHLNAKKTAFPKVPRLMMLTGLSRNKVYRAVNTLIENGYLERNQEKIFEENERPKFGKVTYRVTTKYLGIYAPASDFELEGDEEENALTHFGDTQNALTQNEHAQNGEALSINKKGSINKDLSIKKEGSAPAPDVLKTELPVSQPSEQNLTTPGPQAGAKLPPEEQRIEDAISNAAAYLREYPAMVDKCREAAKDPDLSKAVIYEQLKAWVRYHGDELTFLASIGKNISKSFIPWMQKYQQFKPKATRQGFQQGEPQKEVYRPHERMRQEPMPASIETLVTNAATRLNNNKTAAA